MRTWPKCSVVRRTNRKRVDPAQSGRYRDVARALLGGATVLDTLGDDADSYGSSLALLAVHAAIAYSDALSIAYGGVKSTDGDHDAVVPTLQAALRQDVSEAALKDLRTVLQEKDAIAYQGEAYSMQDGREIFARTQAYCVWAEAAYQRRPAQSELA